VCQHHGLDIGAGRQFSEFIGQQVFLDVVADIPRLFLRGHELPAAGLDQLPFIFIDRVGHLGDQEIGVFGELRNSIARAGVAGKDDRPVDCVKSVGV
jgi:hypothetical protein